jgi:hypothetical protein
MFIVIQAAQYIYFLNKQHFQSIHSLPPIQHLSQYTLKHIPPK